MSVTPLEAVAGLGDGDVRLKLECFQRSGSFKVRGALAGLSCCAGAPAGVVTASAGNHGLGVAEAAVELGARVRIFAPASADAGKLARLRAYGDSVELVEVDGSYDDTERAARADCAARPGSHYLSSYNDRGVVAGQATVALELLEQWPRPDAVVVPVGGGGLIGGIGLVVKALAPGVRVVGVEPEGSAALGVSLRAGEVTAIEDRGSSAEGLVGNLDPGSVTFELARRHVDLMLTVSEAAIRDAVRRLYETAGLVVEPAGAAAVAALGDPALHGARRVACLVTGRNVAAATHRALVA